MRKTQKLSLPSPDKPLEHPKDDLLGHAPFAETLAKSIYKMSPREGFVVALYGTWGSGKTTFLNFVQHYLKPRIKKGELIVIRFNPWWFSGREDLTKRFFRQLQIVLGEEGYGFADLASLLADFANLVSEIPTPYSWIAKLFGGVFGLLGRKTKNINELKKKIEDLLKRKKQRMLVIIDDIDRLTSDEIRELVRVVKAVGDFPYITYFLAFDKKVVVGALKGIQEGIPGEDYLEKIVQVPFELPVPEEHSLRNIFLKKLDLILGKTPPKFNDDQWEKLYLQGIEHLIKTPRHAHRLLNSLSVTYPAVVNEVNPVDFIAIETIRVFYPTIYDTIRLNPEHFIESLERRLGSKLGLKSQEKAFSEFHKSWLKDIPKEDQDAVRTLVVLLFPEVKEVLGSAHSDWTDNREVWRKNLRVCCPEVFPVYFRFGIPKGSLSNEEMLKILASAEDVDKFSSNLVSLVGKRRPDGSTMVWDLLEWMQYYTSDDIPKEHIPNIVEAFFSVGDEFIRVEDRGRGRHLIFDNSQRISMVLRQLLARCSKVENYNALKNAILQGNAISTIVREVSLLETQHGARREKPKPEEERLLTLDQMNELKLLTIDKVRGLAKKGLLFQTENFGLILYRWNDWGKEGEAKAWVDNFAKEDSSLVELSERFWLHDPDGRIRLKERKDFLVPEQYIERVRRLLKEANLTENQRHALEAFIKEFEEMQKNERNDSNVGQSS